MDPAPPNYEIEYVEEPIQKEEFVPQLNVPLQQEMVTLWYCFSNDAE